MHVKKQYRDLDLKKAVQLMSPHAKKGSSQHRMLTVFLRSRKRRIIKPAERHNNHGYTCGDQLAPMLPPPAVLTAVHSEAIPLVPEAKQLPAYEYYGLEECLREG